MTKSPDTIVRVIMTAVKISALGQTRLTAKSIKKAAALVRDKERRERLAQERQP